MCHFVHGNSHYHTEYLKPMQLSQHAFSKSSTIAIWSKNLVAMQKFAKVNFLRVEQKFQSTWVGVHMMMMMMMMMMNGDDDDDEQWM